MTIIIIYFFMVMIIIKVLRLLAQLQQIVEEETMNPTLTSSTPLSRRGEGSIARREPERNPKP